MRSWNTAKDGKTISPVNPDVQVSLRTYSLPSHRILSSKSIAYPTRKIRAVHQFMKLEIQFRSVKLTCFWPGTIFPYRGSSYLVTIPFSPWASWSTSRPLWSSSWTLQPAEFTVSCEFTENLKNIIANEPDTRQKIREILSWWWT
jgi:hypothetical protein